MKKFIATIATLGMLITTQSQANIIETPDKEDTKSTQIKTIAAKMAGHLVNGYLQTSVIFTLVNASVYTSMLILEKEANNYNLPTQQ